MKDPILFGKIKETDKLYFIADWQDEHCDLTFDKLIDFMGKDKDETKISNNIDLTIKGGNMANKEQFKKEKKKKKKK